MCWSGEASAVLATIGLGTTCYAAYKGQSKLLWMTLGYFSLMELLQAFTYVFIDDCGNSWNQVLTLLGYVHIAFQPFFINAFSMYFIPTVVRERIQTGVYMLCFVATIFMLIQLYPFEWAGLCQPRRAMCAAQLCSVHGNWHIAWEIPYNGLTNFMHPLFVFPSYEIMMLLPFVYGAWRITAYHFIMGPTFAYFLTDNWNEWPAVWCLLSIGFLLIVVKTPLQRWMHVKSWPLWPKAWLK